MPWRLYWRVNPAPGTLSCQITNWSFPQWQRMRKWGPQRGTQPSPLTSNSFGGQLPLSLMDFGVLNRTALEISEQSSSTVPCPGHRHLPLLSPSPTKNLQQVLVLSAPKMFASHLSTRWEKSLPTAPTDENQGSLMNNRRTHCQTGTPPPAKYN